MLLTKKGRRQEKLFMAEGIRLLEESLRYKRLPLKIYFAPADLNERAETLLNNLKDAGVPLLSISSRDLNHVTDTDTSQSVIGIFEIPEFHYEEIARHGPPRILVLDNISDPGNAGTLFRSALAFGFNTVIVTSETVEPYNPKVVRSSAGEIFALTIAELESRDLARLKADGNYSIWAADIEGEDLANVTRDFDKGQRIMLAIGSEATGLTASIKKLADRKVRIMHYDRVESLNAAVAGSIIMREIYQRKIEMEK